MNSKHSPKHPKVDAYIRKDPSWQAELEALRELILASGLTEDLKWHKPCYTHNGSNLVATARLKNHCWLMFFKGALLNDPEGLLQKAGENSQSMRVVDFTSTDQIAANAGIIRDLIAEAIAAEKAGLKVDFKESRNLTFPEEFIDRLDDVPDLKEAFDALTPGRQREYSLYFNGAKQSKTRTTRVAKCIPLILSGKGLTDR